jgi:hypothetical protein
MKQNLPGLRVRVYVDGVDIFTPQYYGLFTARLVAEDRSRTGKLCRLVGENYDWEEVWFPDGSVFRGTFAQCAEAVKWKTEVAGGAAR